MAFLEPDRFFSRVTMIDIERDILVLGFTHVLIDIDNTLLTRDTHEVPRDVGFWLAKARDAGIVFCLLSNNWHEGVHGLAQRLDLPIVSHAVKPLPPAFLIARGKIGGKRKSTLVIGDQLITDVLGAHILGMKAYMVCPLVEQDLKHTLLLRNVERMILRDRKPEEVPAPALLQECAAVGNDPVGFETAGEETSSGNLERLAGAEALQEAALLSQKKEVGV